MSKEEMKQTINDFFDSAIRAEKILHLGTMCMDDSWPDIASKAFEDDPDDVWAALGLAEPDEISQEEWGEAIRDARKLGFLVQFATPVPDRFYDGGYTFSWGHYTLHWIYDESFENACVRALKWQEEFVERRRNLATNAQQDNPRPCGD